MLIFLSGFWLSRSGKPYSAILFNIHKLIALGAIIFLGIMVSKMHQAFPLAPLHLILIVAAGLLFIATMVTGGLLNIDRTWPAAILVGHRVLPFLTTLITVLVLYWLVLVQRIR